MPEPHHVSPHALVPLAEAATAFPCADVAALTTWATVGYPCNTEGERAYLRVTPGPDPHTCPTWVATFTREVVEAERQAPAGEFFPHRAALSTLGGV